MMSTLNGEGQCNVCNMPQHYPYEAVMGYYYFRPYNYRHIAEHQRAVTVWGGDPRNPYSNDLFKSVYAEMEAMPWTDSAPGEEVPAPSIDPAAEISNGTVRQLRLMSARAGVR